MFGKLHFINNILLFSKWQETEKDAIKGWGLKKPLGARAPALFQNYSKVPLLDK